MKYEKFDKEGRLFVYNDLIDDLKESISISDGIELPPALFTMIKERNKTTMKEENKTMRTEQILNLWRSRKETELENDFNEKRENIYLQDELYSQVKSKIEEVNQLLYENGYSKKEIQISEDRYSDNKTDGLISKVDDEEVTKERELAESCKEINAMLIACENYEQEIAVLKNYGVIGDDEKLAC